LRVADGSTLTDTYDAAHRLTQIADNLNSKIVYKRELSRVARIRADVVSKAAFGYHQNIVISGRRHDRS